MDAFLDRAADAALDSARARADCGGYCADRASCLGLARCASMKFSTSGRMFRRQLLPGEDAVVARARFQMLGLLVVRQPGQQVQRRNALAGRGNVVLRAFDRHHRDLGDRADIDLAGPPR